MYRNNFYLCVQLCFSLFIMEYEKSESEIAHFGFSIQQLKQSHRMMIEQFLKDTISTMARQLDVLDLSIESTEKFRSKVDKIFENTRKSIEKILQQFDDLFEEHFSVPRNISAIPVTYTDDFEQNLEDIFKSMELCYKQNDILSKHCRSELEAQIEIEPVLIEETTLNEILEPALCVSLQLQKEKNNLNILQDVLKAEEIKEYKSKFNN